MEGVRDNSLKNFLLIFFSINYVLWGVNWEIPLLGLPFSYFFVAIILFSALFLPQSSQSLKDFSPIFFFICIIIIYSLLGLPDVLTSDDVSRDVNFLIETLIKLMIAILCVFVCLSLFRSELDIRTFVSFCSVLLFPLSLYLYWKYKIIWDVPWLGVDIEVPSKAGKNSLGAAVTILAPFFFINFKYDYFYKFISIIGLTAFCILLFNINSRAMVVITLLQLFCFFYFTKMMSNKMKILVIMMLSIFIIPLLISDNSIVRWITKRNVNQVIVNDSVVDTLAASHRFWLLQEAAQGFIDSKGIGNGTASFRIRPSNLGNRTETHNDYMLILYEQGIIGILFFLNLLIYRIYISIKTLHRTKDPCVFASVCSMVGIMAALIFMNFYTSLIFWTLLGLNIAIVNFASKSRNLYSS